MSVKNLIVVKKRKKNSSKSNNEKKLPFDLRHSSVAESMAFCNTFYEIRKNHLLIAFNKIFDYSTIRQILPN